jgi:hypothetical protein
MLVPHRSANGEVQKFYGATVVCCCHTPEQLPQASIRIVKQSKFVTRMVTQTRRYTISYEVTSSTAISSDAIDNDK